MSFFGVPPNAFGIVLDCLQKIADLGRLQILATLVDNLWARVEIGRLIS
jgi:hypothetical protein